MAPDSPAKTHLTTRRAFIAAMGFGGVGLYGLWAAYGAAPGPLALLGLDGRHDDAHGDASESGSAGGGGHGEHGGRHAGPAPEEFRRMTDEFIERYRLSDGTVYPRVLAASQPVAGAMDHGGMDHGVMAMDHGGADSGATGHGATGDGAIDVYVVAAKWYYSPAALRLDAGRTYRFRMMALDISHGASIQFGKGGRMARLRPGRVTEMELTFREKGRYLMHCTVYCGQAHDFMQATIEVV